jgi:peptide chain release factor
MEEKIIQLTSGKGPAECERVVHLILEKIKQDLKTKEILIEEIELIKGKMDRTLLSALIKLKGHNLSEFCNSWEGTIQWVGQSPFRKLHKRKNWFVGVACFDLVKKHSWTEKDFSFQTLRSSGPGGQNVNKVESAVRVIHVPSGLSATSSDERSQLQNKKLAREKLIQKLLWKDIENGDEMTQKQWMKHNTLERGNPLKIFREKMG